MDVIMNEIDLSDEMDVNKNLMLMANAGKKKRISDKKGKYSKKTFLKYEKKLIK